jgi:hypothetical protein
MRAKLTLFLLLIASAVDANAQQVKVGFIDYFGTNQVDVERVKSAMPVHEGDEILLDKFPYFIIDMKTAVEKVTGKEPTDVAPGCCDQAGNWYFYIGLSGRNTEPLHYNVAPTRKVRFPKEIEKLYQEAIDLNMEAVKAQAVEDRSTGYALSTYPPLREKQVAIREYAIHQSTLIRRILSVAFEARQRSIAAQFLGYAYQDQKQIQSLVKASRDPIEAVRNNAVRALGVLAESSPAIARQIPAKSFVPLLNSDLWTDRNKGSLLLGTLTLARDRRVLRLIRAQAADSLIEMARWHEYGHAYYSRIILGRIAGIEEKELQKLAHDDVEAIITAFVASH